MKNQTMMMIVLASTFAGGCAMDQEDVQEEELDVQAQSGECRTVQHFTYNRNGSTYRWDVTHEWWSGREFVDERRIGGGFYRQYRVSPRWSWCPAPNESVTLINSNGNLTGIHVCLPDGREEYHSDFQRLLVKSNPAVTYNCDP